ncbi:MAG: 2-hydroxyacyl-CoA dehydratase subunit D [Candidatus Hodarchaeota archaeon]
MSQDTNLEPLKKEEKAYRKLDSSKLLRETMTLHILSTKTASQEGRLAWVTSGFPVEIPVAMNIVAAYPEQYGAIVGSEKCGPILCGFAEELGFSQELCSYARSSIGSVQRPEQSPLMGLPIPQSLLACNNICGTVLRWYEAVSQMTGAPVYLVDTPPLEGEQSDYHLEYVKTKLEGLITFLNQTYNQPFEEKKLEETAEMSNTAVSLWTKALEACKNKPSPLNCADRFLSMAPIVALRGTPQAINFYQAFEAEVADRVKKGIGAITEERVRLLWDNIPPWFTIYNFFNTLAKKGVVFPADSYTHAWSAPIPKGPLIGSIAKIYSSVYLNRGLTAKIDKMTTLIRDYDLDGFVLFSVRSCKRYSLGQMITKEELTQRTGVPGVIIEGDMVDSQQYNEAQAENRVEALLEMIV